MSVVSSFLNLKLCIGFKNNTYKFVWTILKYFKFSRSNKPVVQNSVRERREETISRPTEQQTHRTENERNGRNNKSTIDIIRASFRGRRGKSVPSTSSSNAAHEFSTGIPTIAEPLARTKRDEQSAPPVSRKVSQNKVKQRVDQKPMTPIPAVEKSRRKKQFADKSAKMSAGSSFYEKLRNAALKQQISNNNKKLVDDKELSKQRRRRLSSQTSEKSSTSYISNKSRTGESYQTGSLTSNASMSSYNSLNASNTSAKKVNKKSTFVWHLVDGFYCYVPIVHVSFIFNSAIY